MVAVFEESQAREAAGVCVIGVQRDKVFARANGEETRLRWRERATCKLRMRVCVSQALHCQRQPPRQPCRTEPFLYLSSMSTMSSNLECTMCLH